MKTNLREVSSMVEAVDGISRRFIYTGFAAGH
jgi:hypothetical protein